MSDYDFDLFVIGAGSGGVRAARMAAGFGARVAIAEDRDFGGTCVNAGCIPKKLFTYAARVPEDHAVARGYGWEGAAPAFDWPTLVANKDREIARLNGVYQRVLDQAGCTILRGRAARLTGPHAVAVGERTITAHHILIATGGWPWVPDFPGREHVFTSNEAFHLERLPRRLVIVGGGYIAVEFAGIFHGMGCEVTQIYRGARFLRGFDNEIAAFLAGEMREHGVDLRFDTDLRVIDKRGDVLVAQLSDGSTLECDGVMYATGRRPKTADLGLESCGVRTDEAGAVIVDENYRTSIPSVHAVGDVTNRVNLTPVALAEGMHVARRLFGQPAPAVDYEFIPTAVFSHPPIGTVGLTEEDARKRHDDVAVYTSRFTPLRHTIAPVKAQTLMKLVVDKASDRVVGVHMCGEDAGEIVQGFAVALRAGATKTLFDNTIGIHPSAAEEFVTMRTPTR